MIEKENYKIMLVDDDSFLVDMYATKFSMSGVSVEAFQSGEPFLEKLRLGETADLILLDVVMPGMDGIEILKTIREEKLVKGVPIVMLTNQSDERDIMKTKSLDVASYIVKSSATPSEVVKEILEIIKKEK